MLTKRFLLTGGVAGAAMAAASGLWPARSRAAGTFEVNYSPAQWRSRLSANQYAILRESGTERAYSSPLNNEHRKGVFACAGCALPAFSSETKFDSHTGWPSFWRRSTARSPPRRTRASAWSATPFIATAAAGIWGTSSTTGRNRPACATA